MAAYTSTQDGNWNDSATWGGGGWPNATADTVTIGHDVTYNVNDIATLIGNISITGGGGLLTFSTSMNTGLILGATAVLAIANGGELRVGNEASPIPAAYTAKLYWSQGASSRDAFDIANYGTVNVYGDSNVYGSQDFAYLESDWVWESFFYVEGDVTSKWVAGQKVYIQLNGGWASYNGNAIILTITSMGSYDSGNDRTTINATHPAIGTFIAENPTTGLKSKVINLSRNIEFGDPGVIPYMYINGYSAYTERIRVSPGYPYFTMDAVMVFGWERFVTGHWFKGTNMSFLNNQHVTYEAIGAEIHGNIINNDYGLSYSTSCHVVGDMYSNRHPLYGGTGPGLGSHGNKVEGNIISNEYATYYDANCEIIGWLGENHNGPSFSSGVKITGNLTTMYGAVNNSDRVLVTGLFSQNGQDIVTDQNSGRMRVVLENSILGGDLRKFRAYGNSGNILPLISGDSGWQTPPSEMEWVHKVSPIFLCDSKYENQMELSPLNPMGVYVESGSKTLTFKVYPSGWGTILDQDDLLIVANYLDHASNVTRTEVVTGAGTFANGGWRDLQVSFSPLQDGVVYFQVLLRRYEASAYVLIDPEWSIS